MENNNTNISNKLLVFNAILVVLVIVLIFAIYGSINKKSKESNQNLEKKVVISDHFNNLNLQAKAVYVYDIFSNKVIYQKNETAQLPLASITKLMTALTAMDLAPKNSKIVVRNEFLQEEGDSGLNDGEVWNLKDLIDFSLVVSSNDGARSVASVIGAKILNTDDYNIGRKDFIRKMNEKAGGIGLKQTYFLNESGLDINTTQGGAYSSAEDVGKLLEYIIRNSPEILEATKSSNEKISSLTKIHNAQNTNTDTGKIPNIIASKTGYTTLAGGNLVVAFDTSIGHPVIIVVLGSTQEGRFSDVMQLASSTMKYAQDSR